MTLNERLLATLLCLVLPWPVFGAAYEGFALNENRLTPWYLDPVQTNSDPATRIRWALDVGIEIGWEPDYVGSDDNEFELFPALALHYIPSESLRFRLTPETLAGIWDLSSSTLVQLVLEYEEGREAAETKDLKALEDGANTIEAELTLAHRFGSQATTFIYATYQPEIQDRGKGQVWFVGLGRQFQPADKWLITPIMDLSWGDDEHMNTEFGLTPEQASLLSQPTYLSNGGLKSSTLGLNLQWDRSPRLTLLANASIEYYFSNAADSPVVDRLGSRIGYELEIGLVYRF